MFLWLLNDPGVRDWLVSSWTDGRITSRACFNECSLSYTCAWGAGTWRLCFLTAGLKASRCQGRPFYLKCLRPHHRHNHRHACIVIIALGAKEFEHIKQAQILHLAQQGNERSGPRLPWRVLLAGEENNIPVHDVNLSAVSTNELFFYGSRYKQDHVMKPLFLMLFFLLRTFLVKKVFWQQSFIGSLFS